MKRTPSLSLLSPVACQRRADTGREATVSQAQESSGSLASQVSPLSDLPEGSEEGFCHEANSPWSYGVEPGVDAWRPPLNCQTHDGSAPGSLKRCSFCQRNLDQYDIYMYRGDKAFCSLECRHHQMLMDDRQALFKMAGKRFSMVPFLGPADSSTLSQGHCWYPGSDPSKMSAYV